MTLQSSKKPLNNDSKVLVKTESRKEVRTSDKVEGRSAATIDRPSGSKSIEKISLCRIEVKTASRKDKGMANWSEVERKRGKTGGGGSTFSRIYNSGFKEMRLGRG